MGHEKHGFSFQAQLKKQYSTLDLAMSKYNAMSAAITSIGAGTTTTTTK